MPTTWLRSLKSSNDPGRDLLGVYNRSIIQSQVKGIGFLIEIKPHSIPLQARSK